MTGLHPVRKCIVVLLCFVIGAMPFGALELNKFLLEPDYDQALSSWHDLWVVVHGIIQTGDSSKDGYIFLAQTVLKCVGAVIFLRFLFFPFLQRLVDKAPKPFHELDYRLAKAGLISGMAVGLVVPYLL